MLVLIGTNIVWGQENKKKVAVYVISQDAAVGKVVGGKLVAAITQSGTHVAMERTDEFLRQLQAEHNYQRGGNVDDSQISRLGKQAGVAEVCVAEVVEVLGSNYLAARMIDVETASVLATADGSSDFKSINDLVKVSEEIALKLMGSSGSSYSTNQSATNPRNSAIPDMVQVEGGSFTMGCTSEQGNDCYSDEKPSHNVSVNSFRISKTEITNEQYVAFLNTSRVGSSGNYNGRELIKVSSEYLKLEYIDGKWRAKNGYENYPVVMVTWFGAYEYCDWAGGRLPTEAEWEYAARGGNKSRGYKYAGSNIIEEVAWFEGNSGGRAHEVATKRPNELGLYDMTGNVWEWCYDWYGSYSSGSQNNPTGATSGTSRVNRGGCWINDARHCGVSSRNYFAPGDSYSGVGFRLVLP
ncbi:formylglycine-generating enzyme family protein [Bacteroides sp. OttesenSCG-928-D19]|nr:formylglycine-generating enzyme family protein [Bacteroides sp. OttesenSCG-928-D19]